MGAGWRVLVLMMVTVLGAGVCAVAGSGAVQAAPAMGRAAPVESVPLINGQLLGVSADTPTDAWAVGDGPLFGSTPRQTLIVHWNGTAWSRVPSPRVGTGGGGAALTGVSALSPTDAWAVGFFFNKASNLPQTWILHWNGTAWSRVPSPDPGPHFASLSGVSAVSPTDVWAVGSFYTPAKVGHPLILHWNGTAWSEVQSPDPGFGVYNIAGVSALSGTSAWAAGQYATKAGAKPLTLRWDGTAWSQVKTPVAAGSSVQVNGVSAVSGTDVWAAGNGSTGANLVLLGNGTSWSQASLPSPGTRDNQLAGVSADSATDAWAVGWYMNNTRFAPSFTITFHWNGTTWSRVKSPNPGNGGGQGDCQLFAVDALSPTDAWAVGSHGEILIEHWNGTAWSAG